MCGYSSDESYADYAVIEEKVVEPEAPPVQEVRFLCQEEVDKLARELIEGAIPVSEFFAGIDNVRVLCDAAQPAPA